jgi:hypothetical protein
MTVNKTESYANLRDWKADADKVHSKTGHTFESLRVSYHAGKFQRLLRMATQVGVSENTHARGKRNIIGSFLHAVAGVSTDEELAVEEQKIQSLRQHIKNIAEIESENMKTLGNLLETEKSMEQVLGEVGKVASNSLRDIQTISKNSWRELMLTETTNCLIDMIATAHAGKASPREAVRVMAAAGEYGMGAINHLKIEEDREGNIVHHMYYDMGERVSATVAFLNGSYLISSSRGAYLMGFGYRLGDPITMADIRLTGTVGGEGPRLHRVGIGMYVVDKEGDLECNMVWSDAARVLRLGKEKLIRIDETESCKGKGIGFGPKIYAEEKRSLGSIPSPHPTLLRKMVFMNGEVPHFADLGKIEASKETEELRKHILETRQMIGEIEAEKGVDNLHTESMITSGVALMIAIGLLVTLCICVMRFKVVECCGRKRSPGHEDADTQV